MGLDLFLYQFSQISPETENFDETAENYGYVLKNETKEFILGERWIRNSYLGKKQMSSWNQEKFAKEFGDYNPAVIMESDVEVRCFIIDKDKNFEDLERDDPDKYNYENAISIPAEKWNSFFDNDYVPAYFYERNEIVYQRKGIDEEGRKILQKIGNCVECKHKKMIRPLIKHGLSEDFMTKWGKSCVFWSWW